MNRYDSMNSINAIYSQINKPINNIIDGRNGATHSKKKKGKMKPNGGGVLSNGYMSHAKSNSSYPPNHQEFSGHNNGTNTFQHFDAFD